MAHLEAVHLALLRPCVLHILRAAGYHAAKPSVVDAMTELAAKYMALLAEYTAEHAAMNHNDYEVTIPDVRMAMQDLGLFAPEKVIEEQEMEDEEDERDVKEFLGWSMGPGNKGIRKIAYEEGYDAKDDYLTVLKKKNTTADDHESRYNGTIIGKPGEPRMVKVEGGDITSLKEWAANMRTGSRPSPISTESSPASDLSSLESAILNNIQ